MCLLWLWWMFSPIQRSLSLSLSECACVQDICVTICLLWNCSKLDVTNGLRVHKLQVTFKFNCVVRVVAAFPWRVEDFCNPQGIYRVRLTLEDPTARIYAFLYAEDGVSIRSSISKFNCCISNSLVQPIDIFLWGLYEIQVGWFSTFQFSRIYISCFILCREDQTKNLIAFYATFVEY